MPARASSRGARSRAQRATGSASTAATGVVLQRTTKTARIELPRGFAFAKGRYRWIVEPKTGAKYGNAVVDSKFTIP